MIDPYARLNDVYGRLYPGLSRARRPREPAFQLDPEEQRSLLASLGSGALSGLSYAGLALGKPSAAVRGTLSGLTGGPWGGGPLNLIPFSDTLGITDVNKRVWGRDLLARLGAPKNKYQGFESWKHPGDLAWDFAGFGTEVALDPLFYMSLGMTGASVPARVAKRAGLLADKSKLAQIAGRKLAAPRAAQMALRLARRGTVTDATRLTGKLGAKFAERLGPRQAAMHTTLRDLIGTGTQGGEWIGSRGQLLGAVTDAARKMRVPLQSVLDKPVGGLMGIGPPFGKPWVTLGQAGKFGEKVARRMDKLGHTMAYGNLPWTGVSPGRIGSALFRPRIKETLSTAGQKAAVPFSHAEDIATRIGRDRGIAARHMIDDLHIPAATEERLLLEALELKPGVAPSAEYASLFGALNPAQQTGLDDVVQYFRGEYQSVGNALDDIGQFSPRLPGESPLEYAARYAASGKGGGGMQAGRLLEPKFQSLLKRKEPFADIFAWKSQAMANDPLLTKGSTESLAARLARIDTVHGIVDAEKARRFADYLITRKTGERIYQHPWESLTQYGVQGRERLAGGQATQKFMAEHMQDMRLPTTDPNLVPMEGILKQLWFVAAENPHVPHPRVLEKIFELLRARGVAIGSPDEVLQFGMAPDLARDVTRFMRTYTQPDVLQPVLGAFDSFLNAFKNLVTGPFLAFHGRNWFSGQTNAWIADMFSPKIVRDVDRLLRHGTLIPGLKNAPAIMREMSFRHMPHTDANALQILQRMVFRNEVIGRYHGQQFAQTGQALGRLEESIPGRAPSGFGARLAPLTQGTRKDWLGVHKLRGVFGQAETQWPLAKAGENIGKYVEDSNRLSPFVKLLMDGWDDAAAAQKVAFNQVSYAGRAYTATERSLFTRAFPFYKFAKGMTMWTGAELATKPGGKLAQILRATHKMRGGTDQVLPEYVAQGMAIPIPEGTPLIGPQPGGDKRFLTGGGFMHEDPLQFLGGGLRGAGMEALSRMNPLIKGPLEYFSGQSFFQRGPAGGRRLEDLDPTLGRTLSNIAGMGQTAEVARRRQPVRLLQVLETALANQPLTRFMTMARTLTDPRKRLRPDLPIPSLATAINLATGARLSDVPERTTDALLREAAQRMLKKTGVARGFEKIYVPKEILKALPPHIRKNAQAVQAILRLLATRAQQRARGVPVTALTARSW
jgi:hypothetical protein